MAVKDISSFLGEIAIVKTGAVDEVILTVKHTLIQTASLRVTIDASVNTHSLGGVVQSLTDLKDFADTGYNPTTHKVAGVLF